MRAVLSGPGLGLAEVEDKLEDDVGATCDPHQANDPGRNSGI